MTNVQTPEGIHKKMPESMIYVNLTTIFIKRGMGMMKKLLALVLALAMVMMAGAAFAADITVTDVKKGETYSAYKILNYRQSGDAWSYYLTAEQYQAFGSVLEGVGFQFKAVADGSEYYVDNTESFTDGAALADALKSADLSNALAKVENVEASADGDAVFSNLEPGYWFVTTSLGSLASLASYDATELIVEKNSVPELDKTQSATADSGYADDTLDFNVGDTVYYQCEITDGKGTNAAITLTDTMTEGLTYQNDAKVYVGDTEITAADDTFTLTNNTDGFKIVFAAAYVAGLNEGDKVVVKYSAVINDKAVVDTKEENTNTAKIEYSEQSQEDKVDLETYDFIVKKVDENGDYLAGAEFKLYDAATDGNEIKLSKDGTGYVKDANGTEVIAVDSADGVNVRGFAPGTYYLEEVTVPDGYNKLAARVSVTITSGATEPVVIEVENKAGTELPSTGGMGTTIFYVIGGLLIIGAAVILVARRKAHE